MQRVISQSDFDNWNADEVTKAFRLAIADQIQQAKETLANQAGLIPTEDNFLRGYIRAMFDVLEFRIDSLEEEPND